MKVKSFSAMTSETLDKKINDFLVNNHIEVIDIKFSSTIFFFSAMVMFNEQM